MPARELPGFYYDEEKNRYFPLSAKPKPAESFPGASLVSVGSGSDSSQSRVSAKRTRSQSTSARPPQASSTRPHDPYDNSPHRLRGIRQAPSAPSRRRQVHAMDMSHLASTSACLTLSPSSSALGSPINALRACKSADGNSVIVISGDAGGLVSSAQVPLDHFTAQSTGGAAIQDAWAFECAMDPVLNVMESEGRWIASSYNGGTFSLFVKNPQIDQGFMLSYKHLQDVWTSDVLERRLCIGMHNILSVLSDIEHSRAGLVNHNTGSDALSVYQENHLLYAGLRSSSLLRFDLRERRTPKPPPPILSTSSSITNLARLWEHELLVASMDGALEHYDTRFTSPGRGHTEPITTFRGHVNAYRHNLPVALTPTHDVVLAAGLDGYLRAWSTRTGKPIAPQATVDESSTAFFDVKRGASSTPSYFRRAHAISVNPFATRFSEPLQALDVLEVDGQTYLLGAAGNRVLRWSLGRGAGLE